MKDPLYGLNAAGNCVPPLSVSEIEAYVDLIKRTSVLGKTYAIYCHKLGDPLPKLTYDYSDDSTVCSSVVLQLDCDDWVFVSNAKVGIRIPHVDIYSSSSLRFMEPLPPSMKMFMTHFFPSKHTLRVHHSLDCTSVDKGGTLTALLNLYSTIVTDRKLKFNILAKSNIFEQVAVAIRKSVKENNLLRFTDNECFSVSLPTDEISLESPDSVRFLSDQELQRNYAVNERARLTKFMAQKRLSLPLDLSSDSDDDDFEKKQPAFCHKSAKRHKTTINSDSEIDNLPKFTEPSDSDRLHSKNRLKSIKDLLDGSQISRQDGGNLMTSIENVSEFTKTISSSSAESHDECATSASLQSGNQTPSIHRVHPVAKGPLGSTNNTDNSLKLAKNGVNKSNKAHMACRHPKCWKGKADRKLHFHCLICKTYWSKEYSRVTSHMVKCPLKSSMIMDSLNDTVNQPEDSLSDNIGQPEDSLSDNIGQPEDSLSDNIGQPEDSLSDNIGQPEDSLSDNVGQITETPANDDPVKQSTDIIVCWNNKSSCKMAASRPTRKHFHCKICSTSHTSLKRINDHVLKCKQKEQSKSHTFRPQKIVKDTKLLLQAELICPNSGIYLVRKGTQGPAAPVHVRVNKDGWECTVQSCKDLRNFHGGSLNPAFLCNHALACVNRNLKSQPDLLNDSVNFDSFGKNDKQVILAFCKDAKDFGAPVIKQFLPQMADSLKSSRYLYYSVFAGTSVIKYYSRLRRVLVTYDRSTQSHKCDCTDRSCIHKKIAVLVTQINPIAQEERPEDSTDDVEIMRAKLNMEYVLQHKKIPFDVSDFMNEIDVSEFTPAETHCYKCDGVELVVLSSHNHGIIFSIERKSTGMKVITKHCPSCKIEYRYSEYKDGYFNYNNSSFFTISMMEQGLTAWIKNTPISSFLEIMKVRTKVEYNVHLILNAVKSYMALKDLGLTKNLSCNRCGDYPVHLSYDVIRSLCFDLDPSSIVDHQYESFDGLYNDCCQHDLARGYLDPKSCHFNSNMKYLSVKLSQHLPPLICPKNFGGTSPYTRELLETDKAEEVRLPLERIEQLLNSKQAYKELKQLCDSLHIETRGGKSQMMTRLIANEGNAEVYSVIRKKFTKITGKSGGILRAFCIHGICYALKFLTLPESVADYTNIITSFQVLPNFNFLDVAGQVPVHTNKHFPGTFRPFMGRVDDPQDPLSDLYKDQQKVAVYDYDTFTTAEIDRNNYNHTTAHPVSGLIEVLSLYDEMHESNHHEFDRHLRSLKSTNLQAWSNTSVSEQQNHKISLVKSFSNEMDANQHIKFVTYLTCAHNMRNNGAWKEKVQKSSKLKTTIDELGFLVLDNVDKSVMNVQHFDTQMTNSIKSPHPTGVLQDPTDDASALNSVVYALCHSRIADPILTSEGCIGHQLIKFGSGEVAYNQEVHSRVKRLIEKQMSNSGHGSLMDPMSVLQSAFVNDLIKLGVLLAVERASSLNIGIALSLCLTNQKSYMDYVVLHRTDKKQFFNGLRPNFNINFPFYDREVSDAVKQFCSYEQNMPTGKYVRVCHQWAQHVLAVAMMVQSSKRMFID
ncbi:hypothetical protein ACHWQZ_G017999 [Mnemiopsis leidyi]